MVGKNFWKVWLRRLQKVDTQEHTLSNHAEGAFLVGLWDNAFISDVKRKLGSYGMEEQKTQEVTMQLMNIHMEQAQLIQHRWSRVVQTWTEWQLTPEERKEWEAKECEAVAGVAERAQMTILTDRCQKVWDEEWEGKMPQAEITDTEAVLTVREIEAAMNDRTMEEQKQEDKAKQGQCRKVWIREIKRIAAWIEQPSKMAVNILYTGGRLKVMWREFDTSQEALHFQVFQHRKRPGERYNALLRLALDTQLGAAAKVEPAPKRRKTDTAIIPPTGEKRAKPQIAQMSSSNGHSNSNLT